jgi:hypothetical protein
MHCKTAVVAQLLTALNENGFGPIRLLRSTQENPRDMLSFEAVISRKSAQIRRRSTSAD